MNRLPLSKRVQIVNLLVEGNSMRAISRISDVSINTVTKLLIDVGRACEVFHHETVKEITSTRVELDELWAFCYSKQKNVPEGMQEYAGDLWTWVAIDANTKLVVSWYVGQRDLFTAVDFLADLKKRLVNRVQLTSDGFKPYLFAVDHTFGQDVDYAQLVKIYGGESGNTKQERKYSPTKFIGSKKKVVTGKPDEKRISTSYVERQNLTMRMHMRRFTRLTNGFSKKVDNHCHAVALHFVYYNFVKIHKSLRVPPAMEAKLIRRLMSIEDIVRLADMKSNTDIKIES